MISMPKVGTVQPIAPTRRRDREAADTERNRSGRATQKRNNKSSEYTRRVPGRIDERV